MVIDGRQLASLIIKKVADEVTLLAEPPCLTVFTCQPNFETRQFLALKQKWALEAGILVTVIELEPQVRIDEVAQAIAEVVPLSDGIIIQFPFPHIATADLIPLVPASHDVDVMQYGGWLHDPLPPVVGAIAEISRVHDVSWPGKNVVVVGNGRLVGAPMSQYAAACGAIVTVLTKESFSTEALLQADIIVLGAGVPGLLLPEMVKEGVIVFDAGTSEEGGQLVGDANRAVAEKASLFTPVPGGVGPLTVAILLKNVLYFSRKRSQ